MMVSLNKRRVHEPKNMFILILDVLTLLPISEFHYILLDTSHVYTEAAYVDYNKAKVVIRTYRIIGYFQRVRSSAGLNQLVLVWFGQVVQITMATLMLGSLYHFVGCVNCNYVSWKNHLNDIVYNPNSSLHWFVLAQSVMGSMYTQNYPGKYLKIFKILSMLPRPQILYCITFTSIPQISIVTLREILKIFRVA